MKVKKIILKVLVYFFSAVLSVFFLWYILYHIFNGFESKVESTPAVLATKEDVISTDAYIVRDENYLTTDIKGGINYLYSDGEKVRADSVVADIYSGEVAESLAEKILAIDKKIEVLLESSLLQSASVTDANAVDTKINQLFYTIRDKVEDGDLEYAIFKKDEFLALLNRRQLISQNSNGFNDKIDELTQERNTLTSELENLVGQVTIENSGLFYSSVDGYENIFTVSSLNDLNLTSFYTLVNSKPDDTSDSDIIGKIVNSDNWRILSEVSVEELKYFTEGEEYKVRFPYNSDVSFNMKLEKIIKDSDVEVTNAVLVMITNINPENFTYLRKQTAEIVKASYTGYKIPTSTVRLYNDKKGVFILNGNVVDFKEVEILTEQGGYYIVKEQPTFAEDENYQSKLGLYEMVITSGKNLYPGKIINNSGGN